MSQTSVRRCQSEACRAPVVTVDHGRLYPLAGVDILRIEPLRIRCHCGTISEWATQEARA